MQKTGLLFGSFNPIHIGHLALANYVLEYAPFDEVWFVVSPQNPLKNSEDLAPAQHRLAMTNLAINAEPRFKSSDIEFSMPVPSYTLNTLQRLNELHPTHDFSLIIGSDNLINIDRWHNFRTLLQEHSLLVYPRPEYPIEKAVIALPKSVNVLNAPMLDISSTLIRKGLKEKKNLRFLLPAGVYDYILQHRLYQQKKE
ncbi:nicotinate (nicotinamide) nucleotide adenylyltransferase [Thermophagus sp. OGC60D27]|uniref:nicotinate (nicotinamide) nucleotide adenylyltransferase n=1 Tax=Thermophagus sp. OGC60D27 TaxID=3458415 RepID=UPI00403814C2